MRNEVLIVARTRMSDNHACIGGIVIGSDDSEDHEAFEFLRSVRLYPPEGSFTQDQAIQVGYVFTLEMSPAEDPTPPHIEDVVVTRGSRENSMSDAELIAFLDKYASEFYGQGRWGDGKPGELLDSHIKATSNGSGYIDETDIPPVSTGFWVPDKDLEQHADGEGKIRYYYPNRAPSGIRRLTYVGMRTPPEVVPAGTICRVSLARWWRPDDYDDSTPERCYLQLSQVYLE